MLDAPGPGSAGRDPAVVRSGSRRLSGNGSAVSAGTGSAGSGSTSKGPAGTDSAGSGAAGKGPAGTDSARKGPTSNRPRTVERESERPVAGLTAGLLPLAAKARHGAHSARVLRKTRFVYPTRRWPRRMLIVANVLVGLTILVTAGAYAYADWRFNQIRRVVIPSLRGGPNAAAAGPAAPPGAPMTILLVGSDTRASDTGNDSRQFGSASQVGGQRSDTIMLIHLVPATRSAQLLSIPRDLWVSIPGMGNSRINSAFNNGPDLLVKTIEQDLGIPIDHYVEVDFQSFRDIVSAVGGVDEYFPTPARDAYSLLNIPNPGCYNMSGSMALSFVRARHYEYKVNGRWVYEAESDLARIRRQQNFIKKMINKAQGEGLTNLGAINGIIGGVTTNLTLDSTFSKSLLLSLAERYRNIDSANLPTSTLPTTPAVIGGADVLRLQQPDAQAAIHAFLNPPTPASAAPATPSTSSTTPTNPTTPTTVPNLAPSTIRVAVRNGSGRSGEAASTASALTRQGFVVSSTAAADNYNYATPVLLYGPGDLTKAQVLASAVHGGAQLQSDPTLIGADVELITGQSFQGITAPTPGASGTGSTAATPSTSPSTVPSTTTTTQYELPGTPAGFTPPAC